MDSHCTLPASAARPSAVAPVADRVIDLAHRIRAAHLAARAFLTRYAIEAASSHVPSPSLAYIEPSRLRFGAARGD